MAYGKKEARQGKNKKRKSKFQKEFFETDDDNHLSGYEVFYIFMICNVIGYCVEMVFCYLKHGYWESRQSLIYGPFGLAYGLGGVLLSYLLFKDTKRLGGRYLSSHIFGAPLPNTSVPLAKSWCSVTYLGITAKCRLISTAESALFIRYSGGLWALYGLNSYIRCL